MPHDKVGHYEFYPFMNVGHFALYPHVAAAMQEKLAGYYRSGIEACVNRGERNPSGSACRFRVVFQQSGGGNLITQILLVREDDGRHAIPRLSCLPSVTGCWAAIPGARRCSPVYRVTANTRKTCTRVSGTSPSRWCRADSWIGQVYTSVYESLLGPAFDAGSRVRQVPEQACRLSRHRRLLDERANDGWHGRRNHDAGAFRSGRSHGTGAEAESGETRVKSRRHGSQLVFQLLTLPKAASSVARVIVNGWPCCSPVVTTVKAPRRSSIP